MCVCIQVREVHFFILEVVVLFSFLKIHLFNYVFIEHASVIAHMWGPENNLQELILSLCSVALPTELVLGAQKLLCLSGLVALT